ETAPLPASADHPIRLPPRSPHHRPANPSIARRRSRSSSGTLPLEPRFRRRLCVPDLRHRLRRESLLPARSVLLRPNPTYTAPSTVGASVISPFWVVCRPLARNRLNSYPARRDLATDKRTRQTTRIPNLRSRREPAASCLSTDDGSGPEPIMEKTRGTRDS